MTLDIFGDIKFLEITEKNKICNLRVQTLPSRYYSVINGDFVCMVVSRVKQDTVVDTLRQECGEDDNKHKLSVNIPHKYLRCQQHYTVKLGYITKSQGQ